MGILSQDEISQLQSLSESELAEFLRTLPDELLEPIAAEIDGLEFSDNYANDRSRKAALVQNAKTAAAQEIGPLPPIRDPARRDSCRLDLLRFCLTYFPATFYLPFAPYQVAMIDRFQTVAIEGGKECHAVRRGGLKSTLARTAAIWAVLYGHRKFPVLVGATDDKSTEHRDNFFALMASSETLAADFPEITPLVTKWRQPKRQFRLDGRLLTLHPKDSRGCIVFPDIAGTGCDQARVAPYSVSATDVSGLSFVDRDGVSKRPDLLIFDDVQTPQSASSPLMTEEREEMVTKTFMGLAGLGQKIAAIMVCTVRQHQDLTERFLDRKRHPDWFGKIYKSIIRMPDRLDLWDVYALKLFSGDSPADGKRQAQDYYAANREAMDEGARVAWEHDKLPDEISALQSLMTVRALDGEFFRREIQQEGLAPVNTSGVKLDAPTLLTRLSRVDRGQIPPAATHTTCFIDSSDQVLWWMVCAWAKDFTGWIVDYGTWPDQGRPTFYKSDLAQRISQQLPHASWEEAFVHAHNQLESDLTRAYPQLDIILKDWSDGQQKPRVSSQVQASAFRSRIRPSKGHAPKPGRKPVHLWGDPHRSRHSGQNWVEHRHEQPHNVAFDANIWKSHAARRLLTTVGAPSSVLLPGNDERANRLLVEHLTSENPKAVTYDGAAGVVWELAVGRDNDWWDCYVGNCVAASVCGVGMAGEAPAKPERRQFALPGGVRRG